MFHETSVRIFLMCVIVFVPITGHIEKSRYVTKVKKTESKNAFLVGLCLSAAYLLSEWVFSDKDQDIVVSVQQMVRSIMAEYEDLLDCIDRYYSITFFGQNNSQLMLQLNEQAIYDLAQCMWQNNKQHKELQTSLLHTIHKVSKVIYALDAREQQLEEQGYYSVENNDTMQYLQDFIRHMVLLREKLKFLRGFITEHETYFLLFLVEADIRNVYHIPLEYITLYEHNQPNIRQLLREWALSYDATIQSIPQMVKTIQSDILLLKRTIASSNPDYIHRIHAAKQLVDALIIIKTHLTLDPLYSIETAASAWNVLQ